MISVRHAVAAILIVLGTCACSGSGSTADRAADPSHPASPSSASAGSDAPTESSDEQDAPQVKAGYTQQKADSGKPMRWSSCEPIHWVSNLREAPYADSLADITSAVGEVSRLSGLQFVYDGEVSTALRESHADEVSRDGTKQSAPLLIGWATGRSSDVLDSTDGLLGETQIFGDDGADGSGEILAAILALNAEVTDFEPGFGSGEHWGGVILHELAHALGLDHVSNQGELMNPELEDDLADFGPGDRAGLKVAGSAGCY